MRDTINTATITYHEELSTAPDGALTIRADDVHIIDAGRMGPDVMWKFATISWSSPTSAPASGHQGARPAWEGPPEIHWFPPMPAEGGPDER